MATARGWLANRWLTFVAGLCAAVPVMASTVSALSDGWIPAGDQAIIATRAYDVFTSHTPLVGQHSDAGALIGRTVYSLGPMLYWPLALPARFGSPGTLTLTIGLVNTLAIIGVVALARRRGGRALMFVTAIALALMCRSLAPEVLHDIWNPSAALLPFTLLIFLCWSVACGEHRLLPLTVLVASFVVQCQLAFLAPSLGMLAVGLAGLTVSRMPFRARRQAPEPSRRGADPARRSRGSVWRWALAALLVALICWTPPAIDQIEGKPGNLTEVVRTATAKQSKLGSTVGWHAVVRAIGVPPWWLRNPKSPWQRKAEVRTASSTLATVSCLLLLCALLAIAAVGLLRRRTDLWAGAVICLALCASLAADAAATPTPRLFSSTLGYTMWWGSPAGMFVWVMLGFSAAVMLGARFTSRLRVRSLSRPRLPAVASTVGVGAAALAGAAVATGQQPDYHLPEYRPLGAMFAGLNRDVPKGRTVRLIGSLGDETFRFKMAARFALVRRGIRPLSPGTDTRLGSWYELHRHRYDCTVYLNDGNRSPARGAAVIARLTFNDSTGSYPISVWVSRAGCPRSGSTNPRVSSASWTAPSSRPAGSLGPLAELRGGS
jgi:hypothetical protein